MSVSSKSPSSFLGLADACPGAGGWQERTGLGLTGLGATLYVLSDRDTIVEMHTCLESQSFLRKMDHESAGERGHGDGGR